VASDDGSVAVRENGLDDEGEDYLLMDVLDFVD
jgi:hypothetical protein